MKLIGSSLRGHYNYYGVNGNINMLKNFYEYVKLACCRMLNRRDQKGKFPAGKFLRTWKFYVEPPRIAVEIWNYKPMLI